MLKNRYLYAAPLALTLATLIAGCGGGSGSGSGPTTNNETGQVSVSLVDAPAPDISALNITIDRVEAHVVNPTDLNDDDNSHWKAITSVPQSFDLLDLRFNEAILGSTTLPAGAYKQVRLFPSSATVTDASGTYPVIIPSASNTGIKINVNYNISADQITTILLDFNVSKSLLKTGNGQYRLKPVIPAVVKVLSGTISGTVSDGNAPIDGAEITAVYAAGNAYAVGTEVNNSISAADGAFKIWALLPGTYDLTVTSPTGTVVSKTGVVVSANSDANVGTLTAPILSP